MSASYWTYRHCGECGEETALLLDVGGDMAGCMSCYHERHGARPDPGEVAWAGAPQSMVDYWMEG